MEEEVSSTSSASDISNKTIVVLVILTVIISILGTVVVLNEVSNFRSPQSQPTVRGGSSSQAQVTLTITEKKQPVSSSGLVTLEILPRAK